jgi:hypothetical protein
MRGRADLAREAHLFFIVETRYIEIAFDALYTYDADDCSMNPQM